jgi:hypothetical protein
MSKNEEIEAIIAGVNKIKPMIREMCLRLHFVIPLTLNFF